jgi:serine/threonine-protein kinase HipA
MGERKNGIEGVEGIKGIKEEGEEQKNLNIMRKAKVFMHKSLAGYLIEEEKNKKYLFSYDNNYKGDPISLTMPVEIKEFYFNSFPPFFDGLLPEGIQLDGLLRIKKIDKDDYFSQLVAVGSDLVGAVSVEEML